MRVNGTFENGVEDEQRRDRLVGLKVAGGGGRHLMRSSVKCGWYRSCIVRARRDLF